MLLLRTSHTAATRTPRFNSTGQVQQVSSQCLGATTLVGRRLAQAVPNVRLTIGVFQMVGSVAEAAVVATSFTASINRCAVVGAACKTLLCS